MGFSPLFFSKEGKLRATSGRTDPAVGRTGARLRRDGIDPGGVPEDEGTVGGADIHGPGTGRGDPR